MSPNPPPRARVGSAAGGAGRGVRTAANTHLRRNPCASLRHPDDNGEGPSTPSTVGGGLRWRSRPCPALPCPALPCPALPCPALPCPALPCPALPCPALPCPALPCPALPCPALPCPGSGSGSGCRLFRGDAPSAPLPLCAPACLRVVLHPEPEPEPGTYPCLARPRPACFFAPADLNRLPYGIV